MPKRLMQVTLWALVLIGLAAPSRAQSREVTGQFGILGEWALTATVTEQSDSSGHQWIGPLNLKHIGFCGIDGPEEKTGELRLRVPEQSREATAVLTIDGTTCTFSGRLDDYKGVMACPDRRSVPMMLSFQ
ncbi:MAG: hypothetical protein ACJ8AI_29975 [Rhodopila sp.]